ncbi:MAG TPA: cation:proton antiporter [Rhabdochlamydiaceae bacterium]|jgi:Kef-type K+ transport system membrane component KefB
MLKVIIYSTLMILGMAFSQTVDLKPYHVYIHSFTLLVLAYIMIEVGLDFTVEKNKLRDYAKDYLIAMTAAAFPWIFCTLYFWFLFPVNITSAALIGRFAAPTSAGVLFAMLAAAGLATTWVYKKARILAIFDDLDTVLIIIPLQMMHLGWNFRGLSLIVLLIGLLALAYCFLHRLRIPTHRSCLFFYAILLTLFTELFEKTTLINLEIILPAFTLGCMLYNPHYTKEPRLPKKRVTADDLLKYFYMFLVGCSLPKISHGKKDLLWIALHVLALTCLANLGKIFPAFCYKKEASPRERWALSIAMWPRGEVGAGILIISAKYGIPHFVVEMAQLSLALNLALTGFFIYLVIKILKRHTRLQF